MQVLLFRTHWCIFKAACHSFPKKRKEKKKQSNSTILEWPSLPTAATSLATTALWGFTSCLFPHVLWVDGNISFLHITEESYWPRIWKPRQLILGVISAVDPARVTMPHFPLLPSAGDCSHPKDAQSLPAAYCPAGPPSAHPAAQGCQEGQRMGAGGGLAALKWRWNAAIILPASPPPSRRMAKLPYELK